MRKNLQDKTMKTFFFTLCCIASMTIIPALSHAANENSMGQIQQSAQNGDAQAQHLLGLMYFQGRGIEQNYTEAEKWWLKAAKKGIAESQYSLGLLYTGWRDTPMSFTNHKEAYA